MNKIIPWVVTGGAVLALVVFVGGIIFLNPMPINSPLANDVVRTTTSELQKVETANGDKTTWKTYTNDSIGISVTYPPDWSVAEQAPDRVNIQGDGNPDEMNTPYFFMSVRSYDNDLPIKKWFEEKSGLAFLSRTYNLVQVGSYEVIRNEPSEGIGRPIYYYFTNGKKVIEVTHRLDLALHQHEFEKIFSSIKLNDRTRFPVMLPGQRSGYINNAYQRDGKIFVVFDEADFYKSSIDDCIALDGFCVINRATTTEDIEVKERAPVYYFSSDNLKEPCKGGELIGYESLKDALGVLLSCKGEFSVKNMLGHIGPYATGANMVWITQGQDGVVAQILEQYHP